MFVDFEKVAYQRIGFLLEGSISRTFIVGDLFVSVRQGMECAGMGVLGLLLVLVSTNIAWSLLGFHGMEEQVRMYIVGY